MLFSNNFDKIENLLRQAVLYAKTVCILASEYLRFNILEEGEADPKFDQILKPASSNQTLFAVP